MEINYKSLSRKQRALLNRFRGENTALRARNTVLQNDSDFLRNELEKEKARSEALATECFIAERAYKNLVAILASAAIERMGPDIRNVLEKVFKDSLIKNN